MIRFEGYDRRIETIGKCLKEYGFNDLEAAHTLCLEKGIDVEKIVKGVQAIAFDNAVWAYTLGAAIALKKGMKNAADAAEVIGIGLQAFCIPGSVASTRQVGIGHGNLAAMLLRKIPNVSVSLPGMSRLRRQKEQLALPGPPIKYARALTGNSQWSWKGCSLHYFQD